MLSRKLLPAHWLEDQDDLFRYLKDISSDNPEDILKKPYTRVHNFETPSETTARHPFYKSSFANYPDKFGLEFCRQLYEA